MSCNSISAYSFCAVENTYFDDHGDIGSKVDGQNKLLKSQLMKKAQGK
jgi:hypothetical protein